MNVPWRALLTNSGEFLHSASWNGGNIGVCTTSHGCTNVTVAQRSFASAQFGDLFTCTNICDPQMPVWDGYGDGSVSCTAWVAGGPLR